MDFGVSREIENYTCLTIFGNVLKQMYGNKMIKIVNGRGLFHWSGGDANQLIIFIWPISMAFL